ncbi:MAG: fructose-bisphosphatase class II family protein, partial [Methylocystis sp.]|nr:fructose-bisphosphatase class II family protein [Methylocystis sp.]
RFRGRGDEMAADQAAVTAMWDELARLPAKGRIVIGEGDHEQAPKLYTDEEIGAAKGPLVDLAVAPLEGATLCAKDMPGCVSIVAMAQPKTLLHAPDVYMDKIAIGPQYAQGIVDLDREPAENICALAEAKNVPATEITVCILDRPRHTHLIQKCRAAGARVRLISDGDVAGVIFTTCPDETGVDMYLGRGGAPEGVLAACVMRCVGGQMQGRLAMESREQAARAERLGFADPRKKFGVADMASGEVTVCATGVTPGPLLSGVSYGADHIETETLVYRSTTGAVRRIRATHRKAGEFG